MRTVKIDCVLTQLTSLIRTYLTMNWYGNQFNGIGLPMIYKKVINQKHTLFTWRPIKLDQSHIVQFFFVNFSSFWEKRNYHLIRIGRVPLESDWFTSLFTFLISKNTQ